MRALLLVPAFLAAVPATAAERTVAISSIDRVRVEGALKVTIVTGAAPSVTIAGERPAIEAVEARVDGTVLAIRPGPVVLGAAPFAAAATGPVAVTVTTPTLRSVVVVGAATVEAGVMKAPAVDLSLSGTGSLAVAAVEADRLSATLIGNGSVTVAGGRVGEARLVANGGGTIDAAAVDTGDLVASGDGAGAVRARARYTAQVIHNGLGTISVAGRPKCALHGQGSGVTCGD